MAGNVLLCFDLKTFFALLLPKSNNMMNHPEFTVFAEITVLAEGKPEIYKYTGKGWTPENEFPDQGQLDAVPVSQSSSPFSKGVVLWVRW